MKKLIDRWKNDPIWRLRWERIALWIFSEDEVIDTVEDMEYTPDGYLDLKGFPLNWDINLQDYTNLSKFDLTQNPEGLGNIENKKFEKVDFSYADFSGRFMLKCKFYDCIFENVKMLDIGEEQCSFRDCIFRKGILRGGLGLGESHYKNVQFQSVKMNSARI